MGLFLCYTLPGARHDVLFLGRLRCIFTSAFFSFPSQVVRDFRPFGGLRAAGAEQTAPVNAIIADTAREFMRKRKAAEEEGPRGQAKVAKKAVKFPRKAMAEWQCAVDNALDVTLDCPIFGHFVHAGPQPAWDEDWTEDTKNSFANTLVACNDQEQLQYGAEVCLERKFGMSVAIFPPPMHRINNDHVRATFLAGMGGNFCGSRLNKGQISKNQAKQSGQIAS